MRRRDLAETFKYVSKEELKKYKEQLDELEFDIKEVEDEILSIIINSKLEGIVYCRLIYNNYGDTVTIKMSESEFEKLPELSGRM
jgi:hypothetical protein